MPKKKRLKCLKEVFRMSKLAFNFFEIDPWKALVLVGKFLKYQTHSKKKLIKTQLRGQSYNTFPA